MALTQVKEKKNAVHKSNTEKNNVFLCVTTVQSLHS